MYSIIFRVLPSRSPTVGLIWAMASLKARIGLRPLHHGAEKSIARRFQPVYRRSTRRRFCSFAGRSKGAKPAW